MPDDTRIPATADRETDNRDTGTADLFELYADDPERADMLVFGRVAHQDRRGFLKGAGLATMGALIGSAIPFHRNMPAGFIPEAMAATRRLTRPKRERLRYSAAS